MLLEVESARKAMDVARTSNDLQKTVGVSHYFKMLSLLLGPEALSTLATLLFEVFAQLKLDPVTARHVRLQSTASGFCSR